MRTIKTLKLALLATMVVIMTSCEDGLIGMTGEGSVVSNEIVIEEIEGVELSFSGNIHLTQDDEQKVVIDAQQNIFENITTKFRNGVVEFDFDRNVGKHDGVDIYISLPNLTTANITGSGDINTTNIFNLSEPITINLDGSGNITVSANAPEIYSSITGSGNIKIQSNNEYSKASITGSGNYSISGTTNLSKIDITGSGDVSSYNYITEESIIDISGSGNAKVYASDYLEIDISGSGDVRYKGYPSINSNITGSGSIKNNN